MAITRIKNKNQPRITQIITNLDDINFTNLPKADKICVVLLLESLKLVIICVIRGKKITGAFA